VVKTFLKKSIFAQKSSYPIVDSKVPACMCSLETQSSVGCYSGTGIQLDPRKNNFLFIENFHWTKD